MSTTQSPVGALPLPVARGGTGAVTLTGALVGNGTSAVTAGTLSVANGGTGATTLTGALVGNGTSAVTAGTLSVANGGTGATTLTGALVGNGTSAITAGTLSVANGGTGAATLTGLLVGNGTSAVTVDGYSAAAAYTPAFSLATAGDSAWTYTGTPFGRWQRLGALVYFQAQLVWSAFANTTGAGVWRVSLPAAAGAFTQPGQVFVSGSGIDASAETANLPANFFGSISTGASVAVLSVQEGGVGNATSAVFQLTVSQVKSAGTLNISGYYFAA